MKAYQKEYRKKHPNYWREWHKKNPLMKYIYKTKQWFCQKCQCRKILVCPECGEKHEI